MILTVLGTVAIVIACVSIGLVIDRRWGLPPSELAARPQPVLAPHEPGAAAATAIAMTAEELARTKAAKRCQTCDAKLAVLEDDHVTYAGRPLIVARFACPACASTHAFYAALVE